MIMTLGGHEKLGLPKPNYPVQEQLIVTPQNTKDSSVENKPEPIEHPVARNPKEYAQAIQERLLWKLKE